MTILKWFVAGVLFGAGYKAGVALYDYACSEKGKELLNKVNTNVTSYFNGLVEKE